MTIRDEWIHRLSTVPAEVRTSVAIDEIVRLRERIAEVAEYLDGMEDINDNGGPNTAMKVMMILKGQIP